MKLKLFREYQSILMRPKIPVYLLGVFIVTLVQQTTGLIVLWGFIEASNNSASLVSLFTFAGMSPYIVFAKWAGILSRKRYPGVSLLILHILIGIVIFVGALYLHFFGESLYGWFVLSLLINVMLTFQSPPYRAFLRYMISADNIGTANSLYELTRRLGFICGPAVVGVTAPFFSLPMLLVMSGVVWVISIVSIWFLRYLEIEQTEKSEKDTEKGGSKRNKWNIPSGILTILIAQWLVIFFKTAPLQVMWPLYVRVNLKMELAGWSHIQTILVLGGILAVLLLGPRIPKHHRGLFISLDMMLWGLGIMIVGLVPNAFGSYLGALLIGVAQSMVGFNMTSLIQERADPVNIASIFGWYSGGLYFMNMVSLALGGIILPKLGMPLAIWAPGVLIFVIGLYLAFYVKLRPISPQKEGKKTAVDRVKSI